MNYNIFFVNNMSDNIPEEEKRNKKFQLPKGVHDVLPEDHRFFTMIKKVVRHRARQSGFCRISTPVFEDTGVFQRGIGASTDIVEKEMFTFPSKDGSKSYSLKPEGTAGVVRAYIEHGMSSLPQPVQLYYIEPHFRYDQPQKGRYRQFHQFGFELIGESDPALDAQIINLAQKINQDLEIADRFVLQINSLGCQKCRSQYIEDLKNFYYGKERSLCFSCKDRLEKNLLRLLDCKEEDCQILAKMAPKMDNALCSECKEYHKNVLEFLDELNINYEQNLTLVRGLDYYNRTVFEFWDKSQGAQNAIGGGGCYDGLVELMGGVPTPAVGYAAGIERIVAHMKEKGIKPIHKDKIQVFVAQLGMVAKKKSLALLDQLRDLGVHVLGAHGKGSIKAQMRMADRFNADWTLLLGQIEVQEEIIIIRDMKKGSQEIIPYENVVEEIIKRIGPDNLDKTSIWE